MIHRFTRGTLIHLHCFHFRTTHNINYMYTLNRTFTFSLATVTNQKNWQEKDINIHDNDVNLMQDQNAIWQTNPKNIISEYPFAPIPISIIRNSALLQTEPDLKNSLIAFKCLTARNADLLLAYEQLFPQDAKYKPLELNEYTAKSLFSSYFQGRVDSIIEDINKGQSSLDDKIAAINILIHISNKILSTDKVKRLSQKQIIKVDQSGALLAYYVQLLIKHRLDYTHLLGLLHEKLQNEATSASLRIRLFKAIITVPNFSDHYSRMIINSGLSLLCKNLQLLSNYQILYCIRLLYNYTSPEATQFCKSIHNLLLNRKLQQSNIEYHVPLILKTIKYSSKLRISCKTLIEFITNNLKHFQILFTNKNITKGIFFSLLFTNNKNNEISQQSLDHLKTYLLDTIKQISTLQQIDESELVRFNKLLIKYMNLLQQSDRQHIRTQYVNNILPRFDSSTEILFYNLLVILRETIDNHQYKPHQLQKQNQLITKYVKVFLQRCCARNNNGQWIVNFQINAVVEIMYQVYRHQIRIHQQSLPHICKFNFTTKDTINPANLGYFFYYLSKTTHEKISDIKNTITLLQPTLETYLRQNRINSIKTIYNIIDLCSKIDFEHKHFYKILENSFVKYLIRNPNFVIPQRDLNFLNTHLIKRGYGSRGFITLITKTLQKPKDWPKLRSQYTEKQKLFLQNLQSKKKQRYNQKRSN